MDRVMHDVRVYANDVVDRLNTLKDKNRDELPSPTTSEMVSTIPCSIVRHVHCAATPLGKTLRHTLSVIYALVALGNKHLVYFTCHRFFVC